MNVGRLTQLHTATFHVAALGFVRNKLTAQIAGMIDSFGAFKATLATMHDVVAKERCAIEKHIATVRQAVIASTPVIVCTVGSLLRKSAMRELSKDAGKLAIIALA